MNTKQILPTLFFTLLFSLGLLTGCENDSPAENLGENIEELGEDVEEGVNDAQRGLEDAAD